MSEYKLVPVEPTPEMRRKAGLSRGADYYTITKVWRAMLDAAPQPPQGAQVMSDPVIRRVRGSIDEAKNRGGMRVGMPKVTIDASDANRLCIMAEALATAPAVQGEPVAWMTHHDEPMFFATAKEASAYCDHDENPIPLYAAPQPAVQQPTRACACTVPDDCETLHWRGQILSMNELASVAQPAAGEEIMVNTPGDVYTLPMQPSGLTSGPRFVVHVPAHQPCPESIREGAPYDDPAFESLCREHEIWGTAAAAQCAVFWEAGKRVAEQQSAEQQIKDIASGERKQ